MGRQYIEGFKELGVGQDQMLRIHLQGNHYPPVDLHFVPDCKRAINACNKGDYNKKIKMCNGITKTASEIVEGLHLDTFLEEVEE